MAEVKARARTCTHERLPEPKEVVLHINVAQLLKGYLADGWAFTHPASGEHRDKRTAAKLKAMGTMPGWPDLILVSPEGRFHGLELKRRGEGLNEAQKAFHGHARAQGWAVAVADNYDAAVTVLNTWGCLRLKFSEVR